MKILNLTTTDCGGAGRAALDLHLRFVDDLGYQSSVVVLKRTTEEPHVFEVPFRARLLRRIERRLALGATVNQSYQFNGFSEKGTGISADVILRTYNDVPDVINLFSVNGFVNGAAIAQLHRLTNAPVYWFLADMAPITGGCHFSMGCEGFVAGCFGCPAIQEPRHASLPSEELRSRMASLSGIPLTLVAGTTALERQVRESTLFCRHEVKRIGYFVDDQLFRSKDRRSAREQLTAITGEVLPADRTVIAVGSTHMSQRRKGMPELVQSLALIDQKHSEIAAKVHVIFCGNSPPPVSFDKLSYSTIGNLSLEQLALLYNSCDIFVSPSIDDIGPFMLLEAMMCERPAIAFKTGVALDVIENEETGLICSEMTSKQLTESILKAVKWPLSEKLRIGRQAREAALAFYGWARSKKKILKMYEAASLNADS